MRVIVLIADGVRPDTLAAAMGDGSLPELERLRREGGSHVLTTAFPSVTGPAYAPFLMGRFPGPVGLPGLRWFDRTRAVCRFPDYSRSYVGYQMREIDRDIDTRAPTMFELIGDSTAALSVITRGLPPERQLAALTLRSALRAVYTHFRGDAMRWLDVDRKVARALALHVAGRPSRFVFAAFTGVDKTSHATGHGSPAVLEALRIVDDAVGSIRRTLEARDEWRNTWLWVTSDHGHSPVRQHEDLAAVVEGFGYRVLTHPWVLRARPTAAVMVSGNAMAHVYLELGLRNRPFAAGLGAAGQRLAERLLARESVDLLMLPIDPQTCAVLSRGSLALVRCAGRRYSYQTEEGDPLGVGESFAAVDASEAHDLLRHTCYPDAVVQIAGITASARSGDIILSARPGWDFRARYEPIPHVSSHGALHRDHMLVPFLTSRPLDVTPRRTADLMPTALAALGETIPPGLDGESCLRRAS